MLDLLLDETLNCRWYTRWFKYDRDAVIQTVRKWIRSQPQAFFGKGIRILLERWKKRVDSGGEYVED
jgi:hypothetical protein